MPSKPAGLVPVFRVVGFPLPAGRPRQSADPAARGGRLQLAAGLLPPAEPDAALTLFAQAARRGLVVSHALTRALRTALASEPRGRASGQPSLAGGVDGAIDLQPTRPGRRGPDRAAGRLIGDGDRLRMLYVLTVADSLATGPSAWTAWKASLVRERFFRLLRALDGGAQMPSAEERLALRRRELRTVLFDLDAPEAIDDFLLRMPASYLLSQSAADVREHYALLAQAADGTLRLATRPSPSGQYEEMVQAAADRPGLLWRVCGVFALHGTNSWEARVFTDARGRALDVFRLADAFEACITAEKREAVARDLRLALEGKLALGYRLAHKLKHYQPHRSSPARAVRVAVDNTASTEYTVIEIHAPDRLGLLYTITRTLSDLHLDIHLAKVATRGPEAVDVFYVRDGQGGSTCGRSSGPCALNWAPTRESLRLPPVGPARERRWPAGREGAGATAGRPPVHLPGDPAYTLNRKEMTSPSCTG